MIADEKANDIDILTDGEYSKSMWHLDFVWGLKGIERYIADHGYTFQDHDGGQTLVSVSLNLFQGRIIIS